MTDLVRQKLQTLISQFGVAVCNDVKRCEALLKDLCPNHKREVNLLLSALREGVVKELLNVSPLVPIESTINRLTSKMHDNLGIAENLAKWAVESWALVLGVEFNSSVIAPSPDKGKVGIGLPNCAESIKPIDQPSQAIIEQFKDWQKIGRSGKRLAVDATHWVAVIDKKTNLMWAVNSSKRSGFPNPNKQITWNEAHNFCKRVNHSSGWCGYHDWRLPSIDELKTLLTKYKQSNLYITEEVFIDIPSTYYWVWSSSSVANDGGYACVVSFNEGNDCKEYKNNDNYVRLVRSGQ